MDFALFFLGEYANMLLMSALTTILFLGGWLPPFDIFIFTVVPSTVRFSFKMCISVTFLIVMCAALPRFRYDQLMALGSKVFLPLSLSWLFLTVSLLITFNWLPA
jgi:NADH-quinone oxidoreductase subunit H